MAGHSRYFSNNRALKLLSKLRPFSCFNPAFLYSKNQKALRNSILVNATSELLAVNDTETILKNIVKHLVPGLGDWCILNIFLPGGGVQRFSEARHMDPGKSAIIDEIRRRYPPEAKATSGLTYVMRTGKAQLCRSSVDEEFQNSDDADYRRLWLALGIVSYVAVPIKVSGTIYGGLALDSMTPGHIYDESDLAFVQKIADFIGLALERALLIKEATDTNRQKDEFLTMMSHELRTPLSAIIGWSQLLIQKIDDPNFDVRKAAEIIERNARQQQDLVDNILDLTLIATERMEIELDSLDLKSLLEQVIVAVQPMLASKSISLHFYTEVETAPLQGDTKRLKQAVTNLLSNAVKFTPAQGRIEVHLAREARAYILLIKDNGVGIELAFLPLIFDRFSQADNSMRRVSGGMGLGLTIVQHIIDLHGGHVWAESKGPGCGTSLTISLPQNPLCY